MTSRAAGPPSWWRWARPPSSSTKPANERRASSTKIARAKSVLAKLEAQDRGQTARALADDLPLFAVPSRAAAEAAPPSEAEQLMEAVKALHPDEMSPREALEALYALRAKLPKH